MTPPGGGRDFNAEGREGSGISGKDRLPLLGRTPPPTDPLTDVGVLQKAADSSLSLQLLVIWGQKGTGVTSCPSSPSPPIPSATQVTVC